MSFFQIRWLRKLVRRNTRPIEHSRAIAWRDRLSIGYALIAWNAFGMVCWMVYSGRNDWAKHHGLKSEEELQSSSGAQWAKTLQINKAKVIQISGFRKVNEYEINNEPEAADGETIGELKP